MVEANGRWYRRPAVRTAVVCLDGVDPDYLDDAFDRGLTPRLAELAAGGTYVGGLAQLPSFTNPNNVSIVTGAPPAVHGIPGNHYRAPDGREVQLDRADLLRAPTILSSLARAGTRVLAVTTKDKLRLLLGSDSVPCVSAEKADEQSLDAIRGPVADLVPRPKPDIYDWSSSHFALELGLALSERLDVELLYVSLTDAVQHAAAPGKPLSDTYLRRLDELVGTYADGGWQLGLVADHGMNDKTCRDGAPNVRYLSDVLERSGIASAHVVLPITDPYVVHHAALGSACWVHVDESERDACRAALAALEGVEEVLERDDAATRLAALRGPLRSHGGRHEQRVPILLSTRPGLPPGPPSNADVFSLLLGGGE
jgi:phosphonoacetate hydrolase